jgi:hypothetical protein
MLRIAVSILIFTSLTGCYCMPDQHDPDATQSGYFSGCWAEASKNKGKTL